MISTAVGTPLPASPTRLRVQRWIAERLGLSGKTVANYIEAMLYTRDSRRDTS